MRVKKHNGKYQDFSREKIEVAILKAADAANQEIPSTVIKRISSDIENQVNNLDIKSIKVDEISKMVEDKLMNSSYKDIARKYIQYHYEKEQERLYNSELIKSFKKKLDGVNIENQNANLDEKSFSGRVNEAASIMLKDDALTNRMSKMSRDNHNNNEIYIHDLDSYSAGNHNCLSIPFDSILKKGFYTRQADVRSPRSINTALQLVAVIIQLQSLQQFGGVSATHLDWTMVPYVRYSFAKHYRDGMKYINGVNWKKPSDEIVAKTSIEDKSFYKDEKAYNYAVDMTDKDIHQGCEALYHNLNTLQSRSGQQLPFSSINYGTCTLKEGRMITNGLLDASIDGVGPLHKTPIFPCGIFQYMKGVNDRKGTPNYDLFRKALYSTSKRIYPNYANVDWSVDVNARLTDRENKRKILEKLSEEDYAKVVKWIEENPEDAYELGLSLDEESAKKVKVLDEARPQEIFSTMGCRTSNGLDINFCEFEKHIKEILKDGKISEVEHFSAAQKDGRGNICPVTIILPTIAMEADRDVEKFMVLLDKKIHEAKDMLIERYKHICSQSPASASFMYGNRTMLGYVPEEGIESALKHGTIVIGQLALAEALQLLIGCDQTTDMGMELAKRIEQLFNTRCAEFKKEYKLNFGVYYTPAENLCHTALKKFRAKYGVIENVSDKEFFTNSMHVPVWHDMTPFEKIDIESQLTGYSNAGCITYVEIDSASSHNIDALETLVRYAMEHDIPYFALNIKLDTCMECGFSGEINDVCPKCGSHYIQRLRRVTGYLTNDYKTSFNLGKQDEVEHRVKHLGIIE